MDCVFIEDQVWGPVGTRGEQGELGERLTWPDIQKVLREGRQVVIRPPSSSEAYAHQEKASKPDLRAQRAAMREELSSLTARVLVPGLSPQELEAKVRQGVHHLFKEWEAKGWLPRGWKGNGLNVVQSSEGLELRFPTEVQSYLLGEGL